MHTPRRRRAGELVFNVLLVVFSAFMLWIAHGISGFSSLTSAGTFPMVATAVMVVCGLATVRRTLREMPTDALHGESLVRRFVRELTPPVLVGFTLAIATYMLLLERLGFVVASYLFLVGSMFLLGSRRVMLNLFVSAASLAAIYVIFQTAFSVVLPKGSWLQGILP
jgi:putative tricarboxylic transport membrane protein